MPPRTKPSMDSLRQRRDSRFENALRPRDLDEFVGQRRVKQVLTTALRAAKSRGECLDHVLLHGGPGLGKTTLAMIIAAELNVRIHVTSGASMERGADVLAQINELEKGDVLFVDEVHRLRKPVEELLYPALEDFRLDVGIGKGRSARAIGLELDRFTFVGATTRLGALSAPFRNRFGIILRLEPYAAEEIQTIVNASAARLSCSLARDASLEIARRARGIPRIANHLLKRSRDYAQAHEDGAITISVVARALEEIGIDENGLDEMDRKLLGLLVGRYGGGPVGLKTLAIAAGEDPETVEDFYEPYLIQAGFLVRSPQGRRATPAARKRFAAAQ